jgi:hypothetical protein
MRRDSSRAIPLPCLGFWQGRGGTLPCDIFLGAHGQYFGLQEKLARLPKEGSSVWIDPQGY